MTAARLEAYATTGSERADTLALEKLVEESDVVAGIEGVVPSIWLRADPIEHVDARIAADSDATYLSNIVAETGQAAMTFYDYTSVVGKYPPPGEFSTLEIRPSVVTAIGDLELRKAAGLALDGYCRAAVQNVALRHFGGCARAERPSGSIATGTALANVGLLL